MKKQFDLVVLGTGSGGSGAAHECREAGWEVAIMDCRPFGGTCALRGCDPKKVLVGGAEVVDWVRRMQSNGVFSTGTRINWSELMRFKRKFTRPVPASREKTFVKAGIIPFHGAARFIDKNAIQVGGDVLAGRFILIATGAKPRTLGIPGEEHVTTSDQFLELEELPQRIVFIGGGYISFEFAHVAARAGSKVIILHRGTRPLSRFDPDLVDRLVTASREIGIDVQLNTDVKAVERSASGVVVVASRNNRKRRFDADLIVHGGGRVPDLDDLLLERAGVQYSERGVKVNEYLQSVSNPAVYAAGDSAESGPPLTPVAAREGKIAAKNMLNGNVRKIDSYEAVPSVVFTIPPLASVGMLEEEARKKSGLEFEVNHQDTSTWYASTRISEKHSAHKVLIEKPSGRILGAHLLGSHSEELINLFGLAISFGLRAPELKDLLFAYPTNSSNIRYMV